MGGGLGLTVLPRNSVKEELREGKIGIAGVQGWPIPIRLKVVSHHDKTEFLALTALLELAARDLGRQGVWEEARR